jgi:molybdopterin-containing oxidoreductase family iron-sulfur binding subunit
MDRRKFVQLVGLASGASILSSCDLERETEKLIPYLIPPDDGVIPGKPVFYRTTCAECPAGCGVTARVIDRKAAKLEGNESHPVNRGALCMRGQASISRLHHPARVLGPRVKDAGGSFRDASWDEALAVAAAGIAGGAGRAHVLLGGATSGSFSDLVDEFCAQTGVERLPEFEVYSYAAIREANRVLFGRAEVPSYRIEEADWVLSVGADLFETFASPVSHAAQFARARKRSDFDWIHVEPHVSLTGVQARGRHAVSRGGEVYLLAYLLEEASRANLSGERRVAEIAEVLPDLTTRAAAEKTGIPAEDLERIAHGLVTARNPLLVAGGVSTMQPSGLDAAVIAGLVQWSAGMIGRTVVFDRSAFMRRVGSFNDVERLSGRLAAGEIGAAIVIGCDPVAATKGDGSSSAVGSFGSNFSRASLRIGVGDFMNPTLEACDVVLPVAHALESWGDSVPSDGVRSVVQPAVVPANGVRSAGDVLIELMRRHRGAASAATYEEFVVGRLRERYGEAGAAEMLSRGFALESAPVAPVALDGETALAHLRGAILAEPPVSPALVVSPSIRSFDGRGREIDLLDEVPDPLTTVSYGAWVSVAPAAAGDLGAGDGDEVAVSGDGWKIELPARIQPGLAKGVLMTHYSPETALPFAVDRRSGERIMVFSGVKPGKTGKTIAIPILSGSLSQEGRGVIPDDDHRNEHGEHGKHGDMPTFYPKHEHKEYRWAMAIDVDLCIGCSACAAACYVENNVPVVGPKLHRQGREMSWIRIEPFYDDAGKPEFQPMLCQHCEHAPCETVCPVYATYHNPEGLNAQVYNRCVGTRYCANNCPYKVRRFNWFDFRRPTEENPTQNPEVSARGRGVMEKCTFCVQRIRSAREKAKDEKRRIADGEVIPACAQTCPTNAIAFGNIDDANSEVSKWARSDRAYRVFEQLGTRPAVYYLKSGRKKDHA